MTCRYHATLSCPILIHAVLLAILQIFYVRYIYTFCPFFSFSLFGDVCGADAIEIFLSGFVGVIAGFPAGKRHNIIVPRPSAINYITTPLLASTVRLNIDRHPRYTSFEAFCCGGMIPVSFTACAKTSKGFVSPLRYDHRRTIFANVDRISRFSE